jgi:hypothetical protein
MRNNLRYDPTDQSLEGFTWGALSGLVTTIAAAADVAALCNLTDAPLIVQRIRIRYFTSTAFGAAQGMAVAVSKVYGFTAVHTGGTPTAVQAHYNYPEGQKVTRAGAALGTGARIPLTEISGVIAGTAALTTATYTAEDTDEPEVLALGASGLSPTVWENYVPPGPPMVLAKNTGLVFNLAIGMGATGVGQLYIGVDGYRLG